MNQIPPEFRRITEEQVDATLQRHLSSTGGLPNWMFESLFGPSEIININAALGSGQDYRRISGDPLAFGQTDVEVVAKLRLRSGEIFTAAALIEDKIDARQGESQGIRYRARAEHRKRGGAWDVYNCVLVAPQFYLDNAYPLGGFRDDGWDALFALEEIARVLKSNRAPLTDIELIEQATKASNACNKPIPDAVEFWNELLKYQRTFHPDVPLFAKPQSGARINVWPNTFKSRIPGSITSPCSSKTCVIPSSLKW